MKNNSFATSRWGGNINQFSPVMTPSDYSPRSIENYAREMRFLLEYYPDLLPAAIVDKHITTNMCYVKDVLMCGCDKRCGAAAKNRW